MLYVFTTRIHVPRYLRNRIFLLWISWFIIFSDVSMMSFLVWFLVEGASISRTTSGVVSLLITSVLSNVGRIPFVFCCDDGPPSFYDSFWSELWEIDLQLLPSSPLFVMSRDSSCVHSSHCLAEIDQLPSCTYSLNEWIPWYWEAIQGGHNNLSLFHILFNFFKLFLDLNNPFEVRMHGLWVLYLRIFQLVPQCHISVDILSFVQASNYIEHILGILQGWYMWDPMETKIILLDFTKSFLCFVFISLYIYSFFFDIVLHAMLLQVWEALYTSMLIIYRLFQAWYYFLSW